MLFLFTVINKPNQDTFYFVIIALFTKWRIVVAALRDRIERPPQQNLLWGPEVRSSSTYFNTILFILCTVVKLTSDSVRTIMYWLVGAAVCL